MADIQYVKSFSFLKPYFTTEGVWNGPALSGLDIETEGTVDPYAGEIATVQIELAGKCWVVHWANDITLKKVPDVSLFVKYATSSKVTKVIHNASFEQMWLIKEFGPFFKLRPVHDTMAAEFLLAEGTKKMKDLGLGTIVWDRYHVQMDKSQALRTSFRRIGQDGQLDADACWSYWEETLAPLKMKSQLTAAIKAFCANKPLKPGPAADIIRALDLDRLRKPHGVLSDRQLTYAAFDAIWARRLAQDQLKQLDEIERRTGRQMRKLAWIDSALGEVVARMQLTGMPVNRPMLEELDRGWRKQLDELEARIQPLIQFPEHPDLKCRKCGHQDMPSAFDKGCPNLIITKKARLKAEREYAPCGNEDDFDCIFDLGPASLLSDSEMPPRLRRFGIKVYTYEKDVLKHFEDKFEVVKLILEYKKIYKLWSTYSQGLLRALNPKTGRVHGHFNQFEAATGRLSASEPNLQNLPVRTKEGQLIRRCIEAADGFEIPRADYSNIEARLIAQIFPDQVMRDVFNKNMDMHALTAASIRGVTYEDFKALMEADDEAAKADRQNAKPANFGLGFGAGPTRLQGIAWEQFELDWSMELAKEIHKAFHSTYPGVGEYHRAVANDIKKGAGPYWAYTTLGRPRRWDEREWEELDKKTKKMVKRSCFSAAVNHPIQGTSADFMKIALIRLIDKLPMDCRVIATVHDEILVEAPVAKIEVCKRILKTEMEAAGQPFLQDVPCIAEPTCGKYWSK